MVDLMAGVNSGACFLDHVGSPAARKWLQETKTLASEGVSTSFFVAAARAGRGPSHPALSVATRTTMASRTPPDRFAIPFTSMRHQNDFGPRQASMRSVS
jgi:hypothetical protein